MNRTKLDCCGDRCDEGCTENANLLMYLRNRWYSQQMGNHNRLDGAERRALMEMVYMLSGEK
jgi:hypothetical protein